MGGFVRPPYSLNESKWLERVRGLRKGPPWPRARSPRGGATSTTPFPKWHSRVKNCGHCAHTAGTSVRFSEHPRQRVVVDRGSRGRRLSHVRRRRPSALRFGGSSHGSQGTGNCAARAPGENLRNSPSHSRGPLLSCSCTLSYRSTPPGQRVGGRASTCHWRGPADLLRR